jgi:hypothetical protein
MLVFFVNSYVFNDVLWIIHGLFLFKFRSFCLISDIVLLFTKRGLLGCILKKVLF